MLTGGVRIGDEVASQELEWEDKTLGRPYPWTTEHAQKVARQIHEDNPEFAKAVALAVQQQEEDALAMAEHDSIESITPGGGTPERGGAAAGLLRGAVTNMPSSGSGGGALRWRSRARSRPRFMVALDAAIFFWTFQSRTASAKRSFALMSGLLLFSSAMAFFMWSWYALSSRGSARSFFLRASEGASALLPSAGRDAAQRFVTRTLGGWVSSTRDQSHRMDPRLDQQATGSREEPVMFTDSSEEEEEEEMGQVNGGSWMTRTPRGPPPGLVQYSTYWSMAGGSNTGNDNLGTNIRRATAGGQLRVNCGIEGCPVCVSGSQF
jgi:hypothetical protein